MLTALEEVTKAVWCLTWIGTGISQSKTVKINQDQWTAYVLGKPASRRKSVHQARLREALQGAILLVVPMLKPSNFSFSEKIADELDPILKKYPRILDLYHTLIIEHNRQKSDEPFNSIEKFLAGDENWDLRALREQAFTLIGLDARRSRNGNLCRNSSIISPGWQDCAAHMLVYLSTQISHLFGNLLARLS